MEKEERCGCMFEGNYFPDDAQMCTKEMCLICCDGKWCEADGLFPAKRSALLSP